MKKLKKNFALILAIVIVLSIPLTAFAATEHSNEALKICKTAMCWKANDEMADFCRGCGESLENIDAQIGDVPAGCGGQFIKCPYCKYYNPTGATECVYCDKDISNVDFWITIVYETSCPECGKYKSAYNIKDVTKEYPRDEYLYWFPPNMCVGCDHVFTEEDNLQFIRYTNDTEDPEFNWDERKTGSGASDNETSLNDEESWLAKILRLVKEFFQNIINFFTNIF